SAFAFPLRCTAQNSPSPGELKLASPATSVSPQAVQWAISGSNPISRVIHNEKYVSGIHGCSTVVCSSTLTSSRKTVSWGSCSGSTSSSNSAKKLSTVMRTWSTGAARGERKISNWSRRTSSWRGVSAKDSRATVIGVRPPPNRFPLLSADLATPFIRPESRVKKLTIRSASCNGQVRKPTASEVSTPMRLLSSHYGTEMEDDGGFY